MTKAEDLMMKWEHVTPSESEAILNAINEALEWAAQQCENDNARLMGAFCADKIRAGKSQ